MPQSLQTKVPLELLGCAGWAPLALAALAALASLAVLALSWPSLDAAGLAGLLLPPPASLPETLPALELLMTWSGKVCFAQGLGEPEPNTCRYNT